MYYICYMHACSIFDIFRTYLLKLISIPFRYFIRTWFRSYKPSDWLVGQLRNRTNNFVESTNNQLKAHMQVRPNVWQFLQNLHEHVERTMVGFRVDRQTGFRRRQCPTIDAQLNFANQKLASGEFDVKHFLDYMAKA